MRRTMLLGLVLAVGCGSKAAEESAPVAAPAVAPVVAEAPPEEPAGPRVEQESFVLEATPNTTGYTSGQAGRFSIRLEPRNGWHVNQDFPVEIVLEAPAELGLAKTRLARADAAVFDELQFRYDIDLTPSAAGQRTATADVRFAICTDENCLPQSARLALALDVH